MVDILDTRDLYGRLKSGVNKGLKIVLKRGLRYDSNQKPTQIAQEKKTRQRA